MNWMGTCNDQPVHPSGFGMNYPYPINSVTQLLSQLLQPWSYTRPIPDPEPESILVSVYVKQADYFS